MRLLIRKAKIVAPGSKYHLKERDLLVEDGIIQSIKAKIEPKGKTEIIEAKGIYLSAGWMDIGARSGDPGYEHQEDLQSLRAAASTGGFTRLAVLPNTNPAIQSKSEVNYITSQNGRSLVDIHPLGAASVGCEGKDIAELYDMHSEGAIGFTDGNESIQHAGLMMRALLYAKAFSGVVLNHPLDKSISPNAQMNEGVVSTALGMRGFPALSEHLMLERDLELLDHTDSKLHVLNISSAGSLERVERAKRAGANVSSSVPAINLLFNEEAMQGFNASAKVLPVLRTESDRNALLKGLKDSTIDVVSSNHQPIEVEEKNVEFPRAAFGAIGLETCYPVVQTACKGKLSATKVFEIFAMRPRAIFNLAVPQITEGEQAEFTLFTCTDNWTLGLGHLRSKSRNTPFLGQKFTGKVMGTVHNGQYHFNG